MGLIRNKKLLNAAKDQSCVNCGVRDGTVVAAHITGLRAQQFGKGRGIKPHDLCVADLCMRCHSMFDQYSSSQYDDHVMAQIDQSEQFMYCVLKTIIRRVNDGVIQLP